jgi:tetratricopeptide (TPR) repeat protein
VSRLAFALLALLGAPAWGAPIDQARACLDRFDLPCAQEQLAVLEGRSPGQLDTVRVGAWVAFHEGRYDDAVAQLERLEAEGVPVEEQEPFTPYRPTAGAAVGLRSAPGDGVLVRYAPGVDLILADQAIDTLEGARATYDGLFGGGPEHPVVLDIYPTASRFTAASGLPPESVQTTNVIALSKWTRLLVTSPRALSRGYGWKDTVAHEYIHLVVAVQSQNRAPVWLQEGLAKHLEGWWRDDTTSGLAAHHESLLAEAVAKDAFVPFEKFARSMAYLDSSEEAALAFAQVSTMVQFLLEQAGPEVLPPLMERVRGGEEAFATVADLAGYTDWDSFHAAWKAWVRGLPLVERKLATLPVVLDGDGDEFDADPLLSGRPDLARFTRLGDLLRDREFYEAALIEYDKATDPDGPPSPLLIARKAACLDALGRTAAAQRAVDEGVRLYPEFSLLQVTRGRLLEEAGRTEEAVVAYAAAQDVNPYDPEVQDALVRGYRALGRDGHADRHLRYARILATGGALDPDAPTAP